MAPSPAAPCRGSGRRPRPGTTARYRFVSTTPGGHPQSELAELYTARRPDFSGLGAGFVGSGGVTRRITDGGLLHADVDVAADAPGRDRLARGRPCAAASRGRPGSVAGDGACHRRRPPGPRALVKASPATGAWPVGSPDRSGELRRTLWVDASPSCRSASASSWVAARPAPSLGSPPTTGCFLRRRPTWPTLQPVIPKGFTRTHGPHGAVPVPVSPFL